VQDDQAAADASTLERIVPDALDLDDPTDRTTDRLHRERYEFAVPHLRPGRLLDIACGVGYGARLLADGGPQPIEALGVDLEPSAVAYAERRYGGDGVSFRVGDAMALEDEDGFDSIVSLETIEHVPDPRAFVTRLRGLLRPGGVLVTSVPTTLSTDLNTHHRHDFTEASFEALFEPFGLSRVDALRQSQSFPIASLLRRGESRLSDLRPHLVRYYLGPPGMLLRRLGTTLRHGLTNRYLTIVWRADG
jgi:SAM-dependent methyltransferase